ncbi:hypothetical protein, partial [Aeromonas hydrophila]|uniref:hypothetical protein n=1 Tax=Aeromonas hydrophila TaxID=644 RepID=UPI0023601BB8
MRGARRRPPWCCWPCHQVQRLQLGERLPVIRVAGRAGALGPICNELAAVPLVTVAMSPGAAPAAGERLPVIRVAGRAGGRGR